MQSFYKRSIAGTCTSLCKTTGHAPTAVSAGIWTVQRSSHWTWQLACLLVHLFQHRCGQLWGEEADTVNRMLILKQNIETIKMFLWQYKKKPNLTFMNQYMWKLLLTILYPQLLNSKLQVQVAIQSTWLGLHKYLCKDLSGWWIPLGLSAQLISPPSQPQGEPRAPTYIPYLPASLATAESALGRYVICGSYYELSLILHSKILL